MRALSCSIFTPSAPDFLNSSSCSRNDLRKPVDTTKMNVALTQARNFLAAKSSVKKVSSIACTNLMLITFGPVASANAIWFHLPLSIGRYLRSINLYSELLSFNSVAMSSTRHSILEMISSSPLYRSVSSIAHDSGPPTDQVRQRKSCRRPCKLV